MRNRPISLTGSKGQNWNIFLRYAIVIKATFLGRYIEWLLVWAKQERERDVTSRRRSPILISCRLMQFLKNESISWNEWMSLRKIYNWNFKSTFYLLTYLPAYLLTCLPTYLLTYLPTYLADPAMNFNSRDRY